MKSISGKLYQRVSLLAISFVLAVSTLSAVAPFYFGQIVHAAPAPILTLTVPTAKTITRSALVPETNGTPTGGNTVVNTAINGLNVIQVTLANTDDAASANVRINPIGASSHIQLWAQDTAGNWFDINVTGWIGLAGKSIPAGSSITTNVYAISDTTGDYPLTVRLVNAVDGTPNMSTAGTVTVAPSIHTLADFAAFDGVNSGTNSYTLSSGITATYPGSNTIKLTGYAPIVTPWFGTSWTTYNYVTIGIKLPAGFIGIPVTGGNAVSSTGVMRYDGRGDPITGYLMGAGSTPLATTGAAAGYLDFSFAANSDNTKKEGLVKLQVIWNVGDEPEYFTIDITDLQLGPDTILPTATVSHDEVAKTITYTFSEPVRLRDADGNVLNSSTYASSLAVYDSVAYLAHIPGAAEPDHAVIVSSAVLSSDAKSIVITYAGSLIKNADTSYVVDAWGKNITDLAGNKMAQDASQIFNVTGDAIAPVVEITAPAAGSSLSGTVAIRGTVTDANPDHYYLVIQNSSNAVVAGPNIVYDSTSFSDKSLFTWNTKLVPDGAYTIRLEARDVANNKDNSISVVTKSVIVDNTAPSKPIITSPTSEQFFKTSNILNSWNPITDLSGIKQYTVEYIYDDGHTFSGAPYRYTTTNSRYHSPGIIEQGGVTIRVRAEDNAGNVSDWSSPVHYTYDATAPVITVNPFITNDNTPKLTGTINDNTATISIKINGKTFAATNKGDGTWELADNAITPALADNTYDVIASAIDTAGNIGIDLDTNELTVDSVAPTATYKHYIDGIEFTGSIAYVNNINKLSFTGEYVDAIPSSGLLKDSYVIFDAQSNHSFNFAQNGAKSYCGWRMEPNLVDLSGNPFSLTTKESFANCVSTLGEGEYYMTHQVYDNAVRSDIPSITQFRDVLGLHFVIDNTAPNLTIVGYTGTDLTPTITGTTSDASDIVTVGGDNAKVSSTVNESNTYDWSYTLPTQSVGTHIITVISTDGYGNETSKTASVVVEATPTPVVTVIPNNDQAVLGATTDNDSNTTQTTMSENSTSGDSSDGEVKGDSTEKAIALVAATPSNNEDSSEQSATNGNIFGLAWYWWLAILAALAAGLWAITAYRHRGEKEA